MSLESYHEAMLAINPYKKPPGYKAIDVAHVDLLIEIDIW